MTMFRTFYEVTKDSSKWYSEEYVKELLKQIETLKSDKSRWISNFNAKVEVIGELMEKSEELLKKFKALQTEKNKLYMECSELNKKLQTIQGFSQSTLDEIINENKNYKQALNEVKKILDNGAADTQTNNAKWIHQWYLARFCEIREIINKAKR